jgi:organic radical activating enzyme
MAIKGCILPWVHIHGNLTGNYKVCCFSEASNSSNNILGDKNTPLMDVWHGEPYKELRSKFLKGEIPEQCKNPCYDKESLGVTTSPRQNSNNTWKRYEYLQKTILPESPIYLDFRFGNICNFRCRTCGPMASTSWIKEAKELFNHKDAKLLDNWTNNEYLWDAIDKIYPTIENIYFAGGEPLVLDGHYKMLEFLLSKNKTDIEIDYNTNLSILTYKNYDLLNLWKHFKKVNLWVSCDGHGKVGEYIRKELDWDLFNANIDKVKPNISNLSVVVSILSIYNLTDLILWANSKKLFIYGTTLVTPSYLSCQILPTNEKEKIIIHYKNFLQANKNILNPFYVNHIADWLRFMKGTPSNREELEIQFKKTTSLLDRNRNENFTSIVPELADWYDSIKIS